MISPKEFIESYNRLVDKMSEQNPSRLFWATDFSSKNRFSCLLPDMLEQMMAEGSVTKRQPDIRLKRIAGIFYYFLKMVVRVFKARHCSRVLANNVNYTVFKTFVYNHSFDSTGQYKDVFWGKLPGQITEQEHVLVLATVLGDYEQCLHKMANCKNFTIVPIEAFLTFKDLWQALGELLWTPIYIPRHLDFMGHEISHLLSDCLDRTFKGVKFDQFVQFWAAQGLVQKFRIKKFYMTYENYPWERMMIMALRQGQASFPITGYQHTVVPESFLNYFPSQAEIKARLLPDHILTTGDKTKAIIQKYSQHLSHVQAACALRFEYLHTLTPSPRRKIRNVLLALEGSWIVEPMVRFIFKQLAGSQGYILRVRTHPILSWDMIERRLGLKTADYKNVEISKEALKADLQWADTVVYYSTAVSLEAIMMGKPVVHVDMKKILSFDPLFECQALKKTVHLNGELINAFQEIDALSEEQFLQQQSQARTYLESYFFPVNEKNLSSFLQ